MTEYLPYDVLLEILHRLPLKSLIRFSCVSRSWNSLITSPAFINSNLTRSHSNSNKLIVKYLDVTPHVVDGYELIHEEDNDNNDSSSEQIQELEFPSSFRCNFQIVSYVNGLFCLYEQSRYIVWNPCIRKFIALPKPSVTASFACYLAFGFDSRTNDYKLVRIVLQSKNISAKKPLVEVYSVNEGYWRLTSGGDSFPAGVYISDWSLSTAVSLNGVVYFAAYYCDVRGSIVLSFDLGDEVFRAISLPKGNFRFEADIDISVFKGLLSLTCYEYKGERCIGVKCCSVFVMKECGIVDSWTKLFTIDLSRQLCRVLGFRKNDHLLVQKKLLLGWELCSYDPESQQGKTLGFCRSPYYSFADNYVENLFLLDKPNDAVSKRKVSKKRKCM
ncbi:F-box/kelch-repeat protein At3g23880 [Quercus suber]|uniref:F-box/kelch-repeat protein At3g23880 n=1 Tax=Quercus suber TaxID=58331 RepID=UPI000CE173AC|nr:F-box/kelch-repeat protein At3g23880-like [Quercus suber]POF27126.1 putative f-box protein [Quercus suber]